MRIGVDVGGTKIEAVALDPDGRERFRRRVPTPRNDYSATLTAIADLVATAERETAATATVGVGIPGVISPATGRVKNANSTWLNGRPLHEDLQVHLGREVRLANDANCFALSEAVDGAGLDAEVVFGVILGTGVGAGIVVRRKVLTGANAVAGEWGHNPLPWPTAEEWPGPDCYCSRTGCVETFLSGPGLSRDHAMVTGKSVTPPDLVELSRGGDEEASRSLSRYEDRLARALAGVINLLDPDVIVLGGGMSHIDSCYTAIPMLWGAYVFSDRVDTRLVRAHHGDSGGVRGAAWLWP